MGLPGLTYPAAARYDVLGGSFSAFTADRLASIPEVDGGLIALTKFTGQIGFYPEQHLEIIRLYLGE